LPMRKIWSDSKIHLAAESRPPFPSGSERFLILTPMGEGGEGVAKNLTHLQQISRFKISRQSFTA
jgi:hypothetical protein